MRILFVAAVLGLAAAPAAAQDATFTNPSPIDFTKPFLFDGARVELEAVDKTRPVEIHRRDHSPHPSPSRQQLIDALNEIGTVLSPHVPPPAVPPAPAAPAVKPSNTDR